MFYSLNSVRIIHVVSCNSFLWLREFYRVKKISRREDHPEPISFIDIYGKYIEYILYEIDNVRITGVYVVSDETYISVDHDLNFSIKQRLSIFSKQYNTHIYCL